MMIFNSFTIAIYNFARNDQTAAVVDFCCRKTKLLKAFVQLLQGNFFKKELWFLFVLKKIL